MSADPDRRPAAVRTENGAPDASGRPRALTPAGIAGTDRETALALPLAVVASQLGRVECELRRLDCGAFAGAPDAEAGTLRSAVEASLEQISTSLATIAELLAVIDADLRPARRSAAGPPRVTPAKDDADDWAAADDDEGTLYTRRKPAPAADD
jgi:hypothetical protein